MRQPIAHALPPLASLSSNLAALNAATRIACANADTPTKAGADTSMAEVAGTIAMLLPSRTALAINATAQERDTVETCQEHAAVRAGGTSHPRTQRAGAVMHFDHKLLVVRKRRHEPDLARCPVEKRRQHAMSGRALFPAAEVDHDVDFAWRERRQGPQRIFHRISGAVAADPVDGRSNSNSSRQTEGSGRRP